MSEPDPAPTLEDARKLARLARLELDDETLKARLADLASILGYVRQLGELDLEGVEPLTHPLDHTNRLDPDEAREPLPTAVLMAMAPDVAPPFVKVPKVISGAGGS